MNNENSQAANASDDWLCHDRLELKLIINLARGTGPLDWSLDSQWFSRFRALKTRIDGGELPATLRSKRANKAAVVRLTDLWRFARSQDGNEWGWLRDFCRQWAETRGEDLTQRRKSNAGRRPINSTAEIQEMAEMIRAAEKAGSKMTLNAAAKQVAYNKLGRMATPQQIDALRKTLTRHYNKQFGQN